MGSRITSGAIGLALGLLLCNKAAGTALDPAAGLNTSTPIANLSSPSGNLSISAHSPLSTPAFVYPGGSSTLYLPKDYSCITSDDGSPDCWITATYTNTDTNYIPGRSGAVHANYANPYTAVDDKRLSSQCASQFSSKYSDFLSTASIHPEYTSNHYVQPAYYEGDVGFTASKPCCLSCYLTGGDVQVYFWPTPALTPAVTKLVDQSGFTFISPTIYVAFRSLAATDLCGNVGKSYLDQTLAFGPTELSTSRGTVFQNEPWAYPPNSYAWTAFDYAEFTNATCTNITSGYYVDYAVTPPSTFERLTGSYPHSNFGFGVEPYVYTYNPCHPTMSVPTQLFSIDPGWMSCLDGISAFYDPPKVLQPADGLTEEGPPIVTSKPDEDHRTTAATGATITPETPKLTAHTEPVYRPTKSAAIPSKVPYLPQVSEKSQPNYPKSDTPNVVDPKPGPPKGDDPKSSFSVPASSKQDHPNGDDPTPGPLHSASPIHDPPKADDPTSDPSKSVSPKQDPPKADDSKPHPTNSASPKLYPPKVDPTNQNSPQPGLVDTDQDHATKYPYIPFSSGLPQQTGQPDEPSASPKPYADTDRIYQTVHPQDSKPNDKPTPILNSELAPADPKYKGYTDGDPETINPTSPAPVVYVQGQKISEGGPAITKDGARVAYSSGSIFVDSSAMPVPPPSTPHAQSLGGVTFAIIPPSYASQLAQSFLHSDPQGVSGATNGRAPAHTQSFRGDQVITVGGTPFTFTPHAGVEGSVITPSIGSLPVLAIGGESITPNSASAYIVGTQTLAPGAPAVTISGSTISLAPSATKIVIDGVTTPLHPTLQINNQIITVNSASHYIIGEQTLVPGAPPITIAGTPISLPEHSTAAVITIGSSTYTADASSNFVIGSQTLTLGSTITISGRPISVSTQTLEPNPQSENLGALIISALGFAPKPTATSGTLDGFTFSADSTAAIIGGSEYIFSTLPAPTTLTLGSSTIILGPSGISGLPTDPTAVTMNGLTFSADSASAIISGTTYEFNTIPAPKTVTIGPSALILGPSGISNLPTPVTVNGLRFSVNPSEAIISGSTYSLTGSTTLTLASRTLTLIPPSPKFSPVTAGGLTFSINPSEAIISDSTYSIGPGATAMTVRVGSETATLGTAGVELPSTTVRVPNATGIFVPFTGEGGKTAWRDGLWIGGALSFGMMLLAL